MVVLIPVARAGSRLYASVQLPVFSYPPTASFRVALTSQSTRFSYPPWVHGGGYHVIVTSLSYPRERVSFSERTTDAPCCHTRWGGFMCSPHGPIANYYHTRGTGLIILASAFGDRFIIPVFWRVTQHYDYASANDLCHTRTSWSTSGWSGKRTHQFSIVIIPEYRVPGSVARRGNLLYLSYPRCRFQVQDHRMFNHHTRLWGTMMGAFAELLPYPAISRVPFMP